LEAGRLVARAEPHPLADRAAWLAAGFGLLLRLLVDFLIFGNRQFWPDERVYLAHATKVAHGVWWGPTAFVPPGHYYALGLLFKIFPAEYLTARIYQAFVSALSIWLLYRLARRVSPTAAALACWVMACYPLIIYASGTLYPQTQVVMWLLFAVNFLSDLAERPGAKSLLLSGLFLGIASLTVPTVLTICPAIGLWLLWVRGFGWKAVKEAAALAVVVALVLTPWVVRNYVVLHRFVPVATVGSQIFFFANNPNANPDSKDISLVDRVYTPEIKAEIERTGNEDQVYSRHAWEFIRNQPFKFLSFYLKRLGHFFDVTPKVFSHNAHTGPAASLAVGVTSAPVLLLALLGAIPLIRRHHIAALWVLLPLAWSMASALFGVSIRYRIPVEPYIIATASWFVWHAFRARFARASGPAAAPAGPAA
jgi:4-amino-4-deoxy-L-arabinose transferase-like glycosyltransferase